MMKLVWDYGILQRTPILSYSIPDTNTLISIQCMCKCNIPESFQIHFIPMPGPTPLHNIIHDCVCHLRLRPQGNLHVCLVQNSSAYNSQPKVATLCKAATPFVMVRKCHLESDQPHSQALTQLPVTCSMVLYSTGTCLLCSLVPWPGNKAT